MFALIDGDIVTYRCGFAAEHRRYIWNGVQYDSYADFREAAGAAGYKAGDLKDEVEVVREVEPVSHALANVKSIMSTILSDVNASDHHVFLSTGSNFRGDIATIMKYKGNRDGAPKPVYYEEIHDYILNKYSAVKLSSIEADDAMAMCQRDDSVICSLDKDMLQVPGFHYNWVAEKAKKGAGRIVVSPEVGLRKLYQQVLTGDSTDNIPGIYGVGPVKAKKLINEAPLDKLHDICCDRWDEYLLAIEGKVNPTFIDLAFDEETSKFHYTSWDKRQVDAWTEDIVDEVLRLLTVGGPDAYAALQSKGEEIPLPSEKEREAACAARSLPELVGSGRSSCAEEEEGEVRVRAPQDNVCGASDSETVHTGPDTREGSDVHRDQRQVHCTGSEEDVADNRATS